MTIEWGSMGGKIMDHMERELHKLGYCRECLNREFGMKLERKDTYIFNYPMKCACCGKAKNIVCRVKFPKNIVLHRKLKETE